MLQPKLSLYVITVVLLMLVLPVVSILIVHFGFGSAIGWMLIGRWFVFCALGMRLFTAGIRQVIKPELTAKEIFHFTGEESYAVVRELGFANLSLGLIGILSLVKTEWTQASAICGGLYMGIAGIQHFFKKPAGFNEWVAMVSDLFIFVIAAMYLFFTLAF
jgi:hypothetical protein